MKKTISPTMLVVGILVLFGTLFAVSFDWGALARQREMERQAKEQLAQGPEVSDDQVSAAADAIKGEFATGATMSEGGLEVPRRSTIIIPNPQDSLMRPSMTNISSKWYDDKSDAFQETKDAGRDTNLDNAGN